MNKNNDLSTKWISSTRCQLCFKPWSDFTWTTGYLKSSIPGPISANPLVTSDWQRDNNADPCRPCILFICILFYFFLDWQGVSGTFITGPPVLQTYLIYIFTSFPPGQAGPGNFYVSNAIHNKKDAMCTDMFWEIYWFNCISKHWSILKWCKSAQYPQKKNCILEPISQMIFSS